MKPYLKLSATLLAGISGILFMSAADGIEINHLGTTNTLVRVSDPGDARYILLPVEETVDDAKVNLLLDGKTEKTFYVRLARNKVDYYVPFDISRFKNAAIAFDVFTAQGWSSVREASQDVCWKNLRLSDTFDTTNREKFRPAFHHTPSYGWMNDPNGMFYKNGEWHLYYQYNPYGSKWQNMTWGHSSSKDLVSWTHHPVAIEPNGLGTVFSGSCAVDTGNSAGFGKDAVLAMYTSADVTQKQSLAWSSDNGETFTIYPGNPVIALESEARDPNMFWNQSKKEWTLILAHPLEHEMLIFSSPDMKEWTLQSGFGKGLGAQNGVWECPDLFEVPVAGTDKKKWVILCNLNPGGPFGGSATQYFIGDFDGKTFTPDTDASGKVPTKWLDFGKDHYATVSFSDAPDNRRTVIGWMSNWQYAAEVPTMQFRSANTLPRDIQLFKASDGQLYAASVPSPEVDSLRDKKIISRKSVSVGRNPSTFNLPAENEGICEIVLDIDPRDAESITLTLANKNNEKVVMTYSPTYATFGMDRRNSGITDFSQDFPTVTTAPTFNDGKLLRLRIFVDRSSIEAFEQDGRFAMTNLVFPNTPYSTLTINTDSNKATVKNLAIYSLTPSTL